MRVRLLALLLAAALMGSCGLRSPAPQPSPTASASPPLAPTASPTPPPAATPTPEATPPPAEEPAAAPLPRPSYTITATLDYYGAHSVQVYQRIHYTNRSAEALTDLRLMVEPAFYPGVFQLTRLDWAPGSPAAGLEWEGTQIRLPLPQPLLSGQAISLTLEYTLLLPTPTVSTEVRPVVFGFTTRQTNLVDWYPFIPPYREGQGWQAHRPGYFGEHLVLEASDFDVRLRLVEPAGVLVAASTPAQDAGGWLRYRLEEGRSFAISASHLMASATRTVELARGPTPVTGYHFQAHAAAGAAALETAARAVQLYERLFGPYPYASLSVVEADFLDGMEYDGLFFLSNGFYNLYQGNPGEYLVAISAHETAHQWWYGLVGNDQALEPWLDEALCTYSERLFYENEYPDALEWWWEFRVRYYDPQGFIDGPIYNPGGYRPYRDAVYLNGANFLEELRALVGDEAFFTALRQYASDNGGRIADRADFFAAITTHSSIDLTPLIGKYFNPVGP
jgi:hypothetical protein